MNTHPPYDQLEQLLTTGGPRSLIFVGSLVVLLILELYSPHRQLQSPPLKRRITNVSLIGIGHLLITVSLPLSIIGIATFVEANRWGMLALIDTPLWLNITLGIIILDFMVYWQHVACHHIPLLWAFHKIHHADTDLDATSGVRFHPVEIIGSLLFKAIIILIIGIPVIGVILFEIVLSTFALFTHANLRLNKTLNQHLKTMIVTPQMHLIHHSTDPKETNSNYGFCLSWWDKCFGSYTEHSQKDDQEMLIGLSQQTPENARQLWWCLKHPFTVLLKKPPKNPIQISK